MGSFNHSLCLASSLGTSASIVALGIAAVAACAAVFGAWHARRAFLGQNFLRLMDALQADRQRSARGILKAQLYDDSSSSTLKWAPDGLSPAAKAADEVGQLFDQVAILVDEGMVGRRSILNNWSVTIVEMFVVAYPVIASRRAHSNNRQLWHSFESLAKAARGHPSIPPELQARYDQMVGSR